MRVQLYTIPTAGPRLVKQLLSENCWFPWLRARWILSFTVKLLKLSRVVASISSACTLSVKTSPVTIPHSKGQNSILEELEVLEQHRCLPYYLREWLWGFLGLIYIKCLEKCSAHRKHSSNISYHHCYGSPQSWSSRGEQDNGAFISHKVTVVKWKEYHKPHPPHCVVVVTRWDNKCGIYLKLWLIFTQVIRCSNTLLLFWAIWAATSCLRQGFPQLENVGTGCCKDFTPALKLTGHQIFQRSLKQIPLPNKEKTNKPRKKWSWPHNSQADFFEWHFMYLERCCVSMIIIEIPI